MRRGRIRGVGSAQVRDRRGDLESANGLRREGVGERDGVGTGAVDD